MLTLQTHIHSVQKIFMSSTLQSAPRLSMPLNCTQSHHLQSAPRQTRAILQRGSGAEVLHSTYKWSLILQATKPRLPPDLFICGKFTARLTTTKCSSAGLPTARSSSAMLRMGERNAPAPQAVRPLAPTLPNATIPPLDRRRISSSKCPGPPQWHMRQAKITLHKLYFQRTFLKHFRA